MKERIPEGVAREGKIETVPVLEKKAL